MIGVRNQQTFAVDAGAGVVVHVEETWADHAVLSSMDEQHRNDRMPQ